MCGYNPETATIMQLHQLHHTEVLEIGNSSRVVFFFFFFLSFLSARGDVSDWVDDNGVTMGCLFCHC